MMRRAALILLLAVLLTGAAPSAFAQGCSQCRGAAGALDNNQARALDQAILLLLLPSVFIFVGVVGRAVRNRDRNWMDAQDNGKSTPHIPKT